jgi:hypothetical protein
MISHNISHFIISIIFIIMTYMDSQIAFRSLKTYRKEILTIGSIKNI